MYSIVKNIPVPARRAYKSKESKYPFADMKVGDSFYAPVKLQTLLSCAYGFRKRSGNMNWSFTSRPEGDGARIWRTK